MRRAAVITLGVGIAWSCVHGRHSSSAGGDGAGLSWRAEQGQVRITPKTAGTAYLLVTARAAAPAPPVGSSATVPVSEVMGSAAVDPARPVVVYALVPTLACRAGECAPCKPDTGGQPDCSVPPIPPPFMEALAVLARERAATP